MVRLRRALLAGIRFGMPILVVGILMTVALSFMGSPTWAVNIMFATSVSCALVSQVSVALQRWRASDPSSGICPHCKSAVSEKGSAFCMACGAWNAIPRPSR